MPALVSTTGVVVVVLAFLIGTILGAAIHRTVSDQSTSAKQPSQNQAAETVDAVGQMAGALGLSSDPDEFKGAVETLCDTVDRIAKEGGIDGRDSRRRAEEIERALDAGKIAVQGVGNSGTHHTGDAIGRSSRSSHEGEHNKSLDHVRGAAEQVGRPESRTARRLVRYLEDPSRAEESEIQETLQATVTALDEYAAIDQALTSLPPNPREAGDQLSARVRRTDTEPADALGHVGEMLSETARELETCRKVRDRFSASAETVCAAATEAGLTVEEKQSVGRIESLARALDRGEASFGQPLTDTVDRAISDTDPESVLGRELAAALRNPSEANVREIVQDVFEALDEAERIRSRLTNVRPPEVEDLAGTVRSSLSEETTIEATLLERVTDIQQRVADDRMLAFSFRQELNFYDKTLLPRMGVTQDDDSETGAQIEAVRERRGEMREQFPRQYEDLNHEIPIHLLDTVSDILDEAKTTWKTGESERALGMTQAADRFLDATESLYRNNAYHILLRQLRE